MVVGVVFAGDVINAVGFGLPVGFGGLFVS